MSIFVFCVVIFIAGTAFGGSPCPPRQSIYPCSCLNIEASRRTMYTAISCHRLKDSDTLAAISSHLRNVQVDQFQLYDSFWLATNDSKKVLPNDLLRLMKVTAIEIVDTTLSSRFMCESKLPWKNNEIERFTVVNSSSSIDALCPKEDGSVYPWTGCMTKLKHFQFSHGKLNKFVQIFHDQTYTMTELTILNLTSNRISHIGVKDFENLPQLTKLDLSHNLLEHLEAIYNKSHQKNKLEFLDVSWNSIETLGVNLFSPLKTLKTFKADHNRIIYVKEEVWKLIPKSLKNIHLTANPVHCGCNIRWISSLSKNVTIFATCVSPNDYKNSYFRKAANAVNKRCDEDGYFRTKKSIFTTTSKSL